MLGLSPILAAVKPSERSDQYKILAAMYSLNAHITPITAKEVTELLRLHLGGKVPTNVNARLRAYDAYVEPVEKGPPLRWRLTQQGLEVLRAMSGLDLTTNPIESDFDSDVGIVCALEQPELEAVMGSMGGPSEWKVVGTPRFPHVYRETSLKTASAKRLESSQRRPRLWDSLQLRLRPRIWYYNLNLA